MAVVVLTALAAVATSLVPAQAAPGDGFGRVTARTGLNVRYAPSVHSPRVGTLRYHQEIPITCRMRGSRVDRNDIWYALPPTLNEWVSARHVRLLGGYPPWCDAGQAIPAGRAITVLKARKGPTTSDERIGTYIRGERVEIVCKLRSQNVAGNSLWYFTLADEWVSARYVENIKLIPGWCNA